MKTIKRIAAFVFAISFCFVLMLSPGANAQGLLGGQQFGAWMLAGLVSINTVVSALQATDLAPLKEWQAAPWSETNPYFQYPFEPVDFSDYLNASTIKVDQGVTTIDGVVYDELWLTGEGANKLKANVFDFKTKWAILSNQAGTLAEGIGSYDGLPIYNVNNVLRSQSISVSNEGSYGFGNGYIKFEGKQPETGTTTIITLYYNSPGDVYVYRLDRANYPVEAFVKKESNLWYLRYSFNGNILGPSISTRLFIEEPFEFTYTSGIVPAEESDIPEDYGLSLKIPHDQLQTFYNTYPQYNVDNSVINIQQDQIDIDQLTQAIFDQIQSMEDIKAEWTSGEEPEPPVPVDPIENIDENVQSINEYQQNMNQQINHMHLDVEAMHQTQQHQQQVQQQMQQTQQQMQQDTSSIDSTLKDATATPSQSDLPSFKFDLRELFPFCIPFDIYRLLSSFDAEPQAPHVQLPIVIQSIGFSYNLDLDFSSWNPVAQAMRTAELIVYGIALAWATGKVIKW